MYKGWIMLPDDSFNEEAAKIVKDCEIFLKEKKSNGIYDCEISDEGIEKLDKYWGEVLWGLDKC